jgi:hypothetical protein
MSWMNEKQRKRRIFAVHLLLALAPCCTHSYISCHQLHIRQGSLKCQSFDDFPRNVLTNLFLMPALTCITFCAPFISRHSWFYQHVSRLLQLIEGKSLHQPEGNLWWFYCFTSLAGIYYIISYIII